MQIIYKSIDDITPYENNPRKNDVAAEFVANSIREFGFKVPIVLDKAGVIITGHTRLKAAKILGLTTVPCIVADDLTDEQAHAYRLADNKTGEKAEWDMDLLATELAGIDGFNMQDFGFEPLDFELDTEPEEDDFEVVLPETPKSKLGEIYQLGRHRLMCGDATDAEQVKKLCGDQQIDLYITDPPYNVDYESADGKKIMNDKMENDTFRQFLRDAFAAADAVIKPGGAFYIWHADSEGYNFRGACFDIGWQVRQCLIWNKNALVMGRQDYQWKHEPCLYGWKDGAAHYFIDDRSQSTVIEDKLLDIKHMKKDELVDLVMVLYGENVSTTVICEDKPSRSAEHPTMKPIKLLARSVKNSSRPGESVLDTFGGSGTTMIACEELNRNCFMMELDPRYIDVIIKRWEEYTGKKAVKIE